MVAGLHAEAWRRAQSVESGMTEVKTPPVVAQRVDDIDDTKAAGAFDFAFNKEGREKVLFFRCPCGCGREGALPLRPADEDDIKYGRDTWDWDGNREKPTLTPSVWKKGHWHGYLTAGVWVSC